MTSFDDWLAAVHGAGPILTQQEGDVIVYSIGGRPDIATYLRAVDEIYVESLPAPQGGSVSVVGIRPSAELVPAGSARASTGSPATAKSAIAGVSGSPLFAGALLIGVLLIATLIASRVTP